MNIKQIVKEMFSRIKQDWYLPVTEYQVYSEQEQVVGVWTDGKPVYRRCVKANKATINRVSWFSLESASLFNVEKIISCTITRDDNACCYPITQIVNGNVSVYYDGSINVSGYDGYIIEYTKTTDSPIQSKVPFEPLVEYSFDEKMIGYWLDGNPLYRKTIRLDNVPVNSETALDHNIQNVDLIWFKKDASWMYDTLEQGTWALGAGNSNVSYHFFDVWANRTKYSIDLRGFAAGRASYAYITFEYTKTTD